MSTTPARPRHSGIPTPGKLGLSTPSRSRASSSAAQHVSTLDFEFVSRAFADAIKANDPAHHRHSRVSDTSIDSLSPQSASLSSPSGRGSVSARPSSAASSSSVPRSTVAPVTQQARTPLTARPPSRHSDTFGRCSSRTGRVFEVGDNVRIESLGFEGTLRYLGQIDGKAGVWAGVELCGGFSGKGKNNGTFNGKQYFICPANCGVFVATVKLSSPTVGQGAVYRPPSVASLRSGRCTPLTSGRVTPSPSSSFPNVAHTSKGRVTPSAGRRTTLISGRISPATTPSRPRQGFASHLSSDPGKSSSSLTNNFSVGSRASKYVSITAKQLRSRESGGATSPKARHLDMGGRSGSSSSAGTSSLNRPPASPFRTPKPSLSGRLSIETVEGLSFASCKDQPPLGTPRARIPSSIAMPPPPSPTVAAVTHSIPLNDPCVMVDGNDEVYAEGEKSVLGRDMSGSVSYLEPTCSVRLFTPEDQEHIDGLRSRLNAMGCEIARLRSAVGEPVACFVQDNENIRFERDESLIAQLETQLQLSGTSIKESESTIDSLRRALAELETQKRDDGKRLKDLECQLAQTFVSIKVLKEALELRETRGTEREAILDAKNAKIVLLEELVKRLSTQLDEEKKELGLQVNELRHAGQETIALYEERLNEADSKRFELEDHIATLEVQLLDASQPNSPNGKFHTASAAQIDNESLRDQVHHLQQKITTLQDALDDVQGMSEKEGVALRERVRRFKEKEEAMKKELNEGRKEMEQMRKSEASARARVQEIDEALRENTVALENARAEVEGLRTELANLDDLTADGGAGDLSSRVAEITQRASAERSRLTEEITKLNELVETFRSAAADRPSPISDYDQMDLKQVVKSLEIRNSELDQIVEDRQAKLSHERNIVLELRQALADRSEEVEFLKKLHHDIPINNGLQEPYKPYSNALQPTSPKQDHREEIMGLKHIVQELQKENFAASQRNKLLEAENKLLLSETDQLRQELKILEDNFDQSILHEEQALTSVPPVDDAEIWQRSMSEQKLMFQTDLEQLRKRLADAEMKSARISHELNKEISELEALVESKIYREDELEGELERTKDKLEQLQKKSYNSFESTEIRHQSSISTSSDEIVCEICDRAGHDIFNCDLLKEDTRKASSTNKIIGTANPLNGGSGLFCEDCDSHGHIAADCPHSLDVF